MYVLVALAGALVGLFLLARAQLLLPAVVFLLGLAAFPLLRARPRAQVVVTLLLLGLVGTYVLVRLGYTSSSGSIILVLASMVAGSFFGARGMVGGVAASVVLWIAGVVGHFTAGDLRVTDSLLAPEVRSYVRVWLVTSGLAGFGAAIFGEILGQARAAQRQSQQEVALVERAMLAQRTAQTAARFADAASSMVNKMGTLLTLVLVQCHVLRRRGPGDDVRAETAALRVIVDEAVDLSRGAMAEARHGGETAAFVPVRIDDLEDQATVSDPWRPGSRRARRVGRLSRMVVAVSALLTALSVAHGSPTGRLMVVPLAVLVVLLLWQRSRPRAAAITIVTYLGLGGCFIVARSGPVAAAGPLTLFTGAMVVGSLWGQRALVFATVGLVVGMGAATLLFFAGVGDFDRARYYLTPRFIDAIRASAGFVAMNAVVTVTFGGAVLQLDRSMRKLRDESARRQRHEKEANASASASNRAALAGALLHNLNNALTVIATWSQVLSMRSGKRFEQATDDMAEGAQHAARVLSELATLGRISAQKPPPVDFSRLATQQVDGLRQTLPENVELDLEVDEGVVVAASVSQLHQLLVNLVLNARDALPDGGLLRVRLRARTDDQVELVVQDDGVGMAPEVRDNIFEPFFTTKGERGTGLGLQSVAHIVGELGGSIDVASAPGRGSTFKVTLAASQPSQLSGGRGDRRSSSGDGAASGARVALAVSDDALRSCVSQALLLEGYDVVAGGSVARAKELLRDQRVDALVGDYELEDGRITELLGRGRSAPPVVIIAERDSQPTLPGFGKVAFAIKPFDAELLLAEVGEAVRVRRTR